MKDTITGRSGIRMVRRALRMAALPVLLALGACGGADVAPPVATATTDSPTLLQTYTWSCEPCHGPGLGGAPKTGTTDEWKARFAKGASKVQRNAIQGFEGGTGVMPARGGRPDLSDEDMESLVDYMARLSGVDPK